MKVKELIEKLQTYNSEAEVFAIHNHVTHDVFGTSCGGIKKFKEDNCEQVYIECDYDWDKLIKKGKWKGKF